MTEPVDYLKEETYRPYWLEEGVTESTIQAVFNEKEKLVKLGEELSAAKRLFMVGSGGSYSVQLPIKYIAEKYTDLTVCAFSGWDFLELKPKAVNSEAAVFLISQSGKTSEVVRALEWSKEQGAITFGLTQKPNSVIFEKADLSFSWETPGVTLGKLMTLYYVYGSIFKSKGYKIGNEMIKEADKLPSILPKMIIPAKENARKQGLSLKDYDILFVLGGGINWGLAYQFALCTLMEMCWVYGVAVNYSEFRHGALEMFSDKSAAVFLRGRSEQRDLEENIIEFSKGNGVNVFVYDSQGLDISNLLTPFTLFIELEWLSYYLSLAKNRRMGVWRYYDKVKF